MVKFIITQWVIVALVVLWLLVCLITVANMHYRDPKTWHGKFILLPTLFFNELKLTSQVECDLPRDKCSYFWSMFVWTPMGWVGVTLAGMFAIMLGAVLFAAAVALICSKLLSHWVMYPLLSDSYVRITHKLGNPSAEVLSWDKAVREYAASVLMLEGPKEYRIAGKIPLFHRLPPFLWILAAALLYETVANWHSIQEAVVAGAARTPEVVGGAFSWLWPIIAVLVLIVFLAKIWTKIKITVKYIRDKTCWQLPRVPE